MTMMIGDNLVVRQAQGIWTNPLTTVAQFAPPGTLLPAIGASSTSENMLTIADEVTYSTKALRQARRKRGLISARSLTVTGSFQSMLFGLHGKLVPRSVAVLLALVVVFAQLASASTVAISVVNGAPMSEEDAPRQQEERSESQLVGNVVDGRPSVSRDFCPLSRVSFYSLRQQRFAAFDRILATAPAEHELRNGTGTPLVC